MWLANLLFLVVNNYTGVPNKVAGESIQIMIQLNAAQFDPN